MEQDDRLNPFTEFVQEYIAEWPLASVHAAVLTIRFTWFWVLRGNGNCQVARQYARGCPRGPAQKTPAGEATVGSAAPQHVHGPFVRTTKRSSIAEVLTPKSSECQPQPSRSVRRDPASRDFPFEPSCRVSASNGIPKRQSWSAVRRQLASPGRKDSGASSFSLGLY